jgi:hypothetical protein
MSWHGGLRLALAACISASCATTADHDSSWELLGSRTVSSAAQFAVIAVDPPADFRDLKLVVIGRTLRISTATVEPAVADPAEHSIGSVVPVGGEVMLFQGGTPRRVERVVIQYDSASVFGAAPTLSLYGRR